MEFLALTATRTVNIGYANWPIIKQLAWLLGKVMEGIFIVLNSMNIADVTLCIIVFTVITRMLMLPLTIKQQKYTKITALMTPEIQALQKKYQGKRDQASMAKMQMEQQAIYDKYGTSMTAGCGPSLLQFPLLFALYPVIYNMRSYVPEMEELGEEAISKMYMLFSINLQEAPGWKLSWAILIPILAGFFQWLSSKLMMNKSQSSNPDDPTASTMKMMTWFMPLFSAFICVSLPAFLGVYWVVQAVIMVIQQYFINRYMDKVSIEDLIKQNIEKKNAKRAKQGLPPLNEKEILKSTAKLEKEQEKTEEQLAERDRRMQESTAYYNSKAGSGSLAAKANMVKEYNERHNK